MLTCYRCGNHFFRWVRIIPIPTKPNERARQKSVSAIETCYCQKCV